ncbi:hypothetical protein J421_0614 [Gemmatirosa kalamazoonensis]|uniref:Uncharacterized protein n=1 Tax=Gemmatirosa kalamazoonensis TaxID=861299 RepID=W0RBH3_9BACT|nr:hypothetical protein [Gemmatirosa kalamazoonensis]AHG88151.1 hypothetical protein J421_0614 [Gemmatirosa kalamazoonensis]
MDMRIDFYKGDEGRLCWWVATPPGRRAFEGTTMAAGRDLPHDLAQFVIESALDLREGFWGLLANGASFKSVPGRRATQPGLRLVRAHHDALLATEGIVNTHFAAWRGGASTPVGASLDVMYARWLALPIGGTLTVEWPVHLLPPVPAARRRLGGRRPRALRGRS